MMAEFTVSYSIEGASGGYLTGARSHVTAYAGSACLLPR
jgi:hypothetical protein